MTARRLVVVRHAHARPRASWREPDARRPLSPTGEEQAEDLATALVALEPARVLTSPARRCLDTLAPLAARIGLVLEQEPLLGEGSDPSAALALLLAAPAGTTGAGGLVCCTHGDVIDGLVAVLAGRGVRLEDEAGAAIAQLLETPKGGRWELLLDDGAIRSGRLVGPPKRLAGTGSGPAGHPGEGPREPGEGPRG